MNSIPSILECLPEPIWLCQISYNSSQNISPSIFEVFFAVLEVLIIGFIFYKIIIWFINKLLKKAEKVIIFKSFLRLLIVLLLLILLSSFWQKNRYAPYNFDTADGIFTNQPARVIRTVEKNK